MQFVLNIKTDNAAFGEGDESDRAVELARILRDMADRFAGGDASPANGIVRDINGNRVGEWVSDD